MRAVRKRLVHDAEDMHAAFLGLMQRLAHDLAIDAADFDVHLQRGHAFGRAGDFEIHIAQMIFVAENVGKHAHMLAFLDQTHGDARHRRRQRHAGIHHRQRAAAHARHRGRTVGFQNFRNDANGVRKTFVDRQHRKQRALGEIAMADLAPARAAQKLHFADAKRREVVMQHEFLEMLADQSVDPLLVGSRAQGGDHQGLSLAAGKNRRAMGARQHFDFAGDRPDIF